MTFLGQEGGCPFSTVFSSKQTVLSACLESLFNKILYNYIYIKYQRYKCYNTSRNVGACPRLAQPVLYNLSATFQTINTSNSQMLVFIVWKVHCLNLLINESTNIIMKVSWKLNQKYCWTEQNTYNGSVHYRTLWRLWRNTSKQQSMKSPAASQKRADNPPFIAITSNTKSWNSWVSSY